MTTELLQPTDTLEFHSGDRMSQQEFHRIYQLVPEAFRAEQIGGIVCVPSPLKISHGNMHPFVDALFVANQANTPGVECADNTTILLGDDGEPQPDIYLRILPEFGGQSTTTADGLVKGAPEFILEIAYSSRSIDLHAKKGRLRARRS